MSNLQHQQIKFEDFYHAFSQSVAADVTFENGQVQIIRHEHNKRTLPPLSTFNQKRPPTAPPQTDRPLPEPLAAIFALQDHDGSWRFSDEFQFVLNGIALPPPHGISGKLWATAIAITVCRQFPEYFEELQSQYDKAMLHADDTVLQLVRTHLDFDSFKKIRPYNNDEAKAIRERLAQEAIAKRQKEDEEAEQAAKLLKEEMQLRKSSLVTAKRLPKATQRLFLKGLQHDVDEAFAKHHQHLHPFDETTHRMELEKLITVWTRPISCAKEVHRLEEIEAKKMHPKPWNSQSQPSLHVTKLPSHHSSAIKQQSIVPFSHHTSFSTSGIVSEETDANIEQLYQRILTTLLAYDKAYKQVQHLIKAACTKYTSAILYQDRFHAFDGFAVALTVLMEKTVDALEAIQRWKSYPSTLQEMHPRILVWNGQNFIVNLLRSLDYFVRYRELIEWYGEEFPLELNPFMLSKSIMDQAEDMKLRLRGQQQERINSLRSAIKLHKQEEGIPIPTWWPENMYSATLHERIRHAQKFMIEELLASCVFVATSNGLE